MASLLAWTLLWVFTALGCYFCFSTYTWAVEMSVADPWYGPPSDLTPALWLSLPFLVAHRMMQVISAPLARAAIVRKASWSSTVYEAKQRRFGSALFKFPYMVLFSWFSWRYVLAEAEWTPPPLFGDGSTAKAWNMTEAAVSVDSGAKIMYLVALGYNIHEYVFTVLFERDRPDFVEMYLHHVTTCFITFLALIGSLSLMKLGTLVIWLHNASDIPVYGAKIFVDTKHKVITAVNLVGMLMSWGYLRLYAFPVIIVGTMMSEIGGAMEKAGPRSEGILAAVIVCLGLIYCLHIYWYYLFLKMGYDYLTKKTTVDIQADIDSMDAQKANGGTNGQATKHD